jgi:hypothetical protein
LCNLRLRALDHTVSNVGVAASFLKSRRPERQATRYDSPLPLFPNARPGSARLRRSYGHAGERQGAPAIRRRKPERSAWLLPASCSPRRLRVLRVIRKDRPESVAERALTHSASPAISASDHVIGHGRFHGRREALVNPSAVVSSRARINSPWRRRLSFSRSVTASSEPRRPALAR